nr:MAG TPA: hypothetical protein [Caudoviricetes sp.]
MQELIENVLKIKYFQNLLTSAKFYDIISI